MAVLGTIMSLLHTTIVNVALHTLTHDLHSSIARIQWVITGYLLTLAVVIPVSGWAARRLGARRVYVRSLVLFTAGSARCRLAHSTTMLVLFRVLQGIGGGNDRAGWADDRRGRRTQAHGQGDQRARRGDRAGARARPHGGRPDPRPPPLAMDLLHQRPDRRSCSSTSWPWPAEFEVDLARMRRERA